jgi:hypothetical protein
MLILDEVPLSVWLPILYESLILWLRVLGVCIRISLIVFSLFFSFYFDLYFEFVNDIFYSFFDKFYSSLKIMIIWFKASALTFKELLMATLINSFNILLISNFWYILLISFWYIDINSTLFVSTTRIYF